MGDPVPVPIPIPMHLERLGRELKCPICLSLFTSAVSLPCNHIFCNACISKSMKSGSHCPVCKLPYTRREIRAAPHMDNLVTIYKSMEIASGVNIFVTQSHLPNRPSGSENQVQTHSNCTDQVVAGAQHDKVDNWGKRKIQVPNGAGGGVKTSDLISAKPAFPAKKRVQVPHHLTPQSPNQGAEDESRLHEITEGVSKCRKVLKDDAVIKRNGGTLLSPLFWLREVEEDRPTQSTNEDQMFCITPPELPSFSDLKDSDDEGYFIEKLHGNSDAINLIDSEMFDWPQRVCSPELLSSPVKMQVMTVDQTEGEMESASLDINMGTSFHMSEECMVEPRALTDVPSKRTKKSKAGHQKFRKAKEANQDKKTRRNTYHIFTSQASQKQIVNCVSNTSVLEKTNGVNKNSNLQDYSNEVDPENVSASSIRAVTLHPCDTNKVKKVPTTHDDEKRIDAEVKYSNYEKISMRSQAQHQNCSHGAISKKNKMSFVDTAVIEEVNKDTHDIGNNSGKCIEMQPNLCLKTKYSGKKSFGVSNHGCPKDGVVENHNLGGTVAFHEEDTDNVQGSFNTRLSDALSTIEKLQVANQVSLQTCDLDASKIRCAFCLSSEESEFSGEIVHYYNGRDVAQDYDASLKAIHSHRNCSEWAPNVYFENDTAINLEAELSRSRRIKCSFCGLKGAALGCYEKSCRKSFHFPCAKSVAKCRWDAENFVMLCPLHASLKLPVENSEALERRIKPTQKGRSRSLLDQIAPNHSISLPQKWDHYRSFRKLVLCCSALTFQEREIVYEFEKLSRVTVLKKWDSRTTHVIASTDENGACKRTLKILRGILEGKWILSIEWLRACMKAKKPVDEAQYEVTLDVYGIRDGPKVGRLRLLNKEPKLFHAFKFYMMGDFVPSYKKYLEELIIAAGGTILCRKPVVGGREALLSGSSFVLTLIVCSLELPNNSDSVTNKTILSQRQSAVQALANSTRAKAVSNIWVLNSIAASNLQGFD